MSFINETGIIATVLSAGATNLTGDLITAIYLIFVIILVIAMIFRIPLEFTAVLVLPFCLAIGAYYSNFLVPITIIVFYVSVIIAKNWIFK